MRKSVLAGLFACAVIFGVNAAATETAGASPAQESKETSIEALDITTNPETTAVEHLLAAAEVPPTEEAEAAESVEEEPANEPEPVAVTHQIAENETLSDIAKEHGTTWRRIFDKNEAVTDPDNISVGLLLVIPADDEVLEQRALPEPPAPAAPAPSSTSSASSQAVAAVNVPRGSSSGNLYAAGYCTWHVKNLRPDLPNNLGNASTWFQRAAAQGIPTGYTPRVGAAAQRNNHIAYVTAVNGDGTITISDMNYRSLYSVTTRTVPASEWRYIY